MEHIKKKGRGSIHPPPPLLYHDRGMNLCVRPTVNAENFFLLRFSQTCEL